MSGLWIDLFVGIAFSMFSTRNQLGFLITTPLPGAVFGLAWSQLGESTATRHNSRDFVSVRQVIATKYEVLVEHTEAARAAPTRALNHPASYQVHGDDMP